MASLDIYVPREKTGIWDMARESWLSFTIQSAIPDANWMSSRHTAGENQEGGMLGVAEARDIKCRRRCQ